MAGSRTERIGTVFSRVQGLLRSGAVKHVDRPVWYDVYEAFPPKVDPVYERFKQEQEPRNVLYNEDVIRARFYKTYGSPDTVDLRDHNATSISRRFIDKYQELQKSKAVEESSLFNAVAESLKAEGFTLKTVAELDKEKKEKQLKLQQEQAAKKRAEETVMKAPTAEEIFGSAATQLAAEEPDSDPEAEQDYTPPR